MLNGFQVNLRPQKPIIIFKNNSKIVPAMRPDFFWNFAQNVNFMQIITFYLFALWFLFLKRDIDIICKNPNTIKIGAPLKC